jgi:hypothetical protein
LSIARIGVKGRVASGGGTAIVYFLALVLMVTPALLLAPDQGGLATWSHLGYDFAVYYHAGRAILAGMSPYPIEMVQGTFPLNSGYFYPPPFAVAIVPLSLLPPLAANAVWIVLLAAGILLASAIIAGAGDLRRAETPRTIAIGLALAFSTPGLSSLSVGNVSTLLGVIALLPLLSRGRDGLTGVAMGVSAFTKIQPAIWIAYLAGKGRARPLLIAAGTGVGIVVVTYLLPGVRAGWVEYATVLANAAASERGFEDNLSITGLLGLAPRVAGLVEFCLLATSTVLMALAGRYSMRLAPLAASVATLSSPTMWLSSCLLIIPTSLAVVALGPGLRSHSGAVVMSGPRLAGLLALAFFGISYGLLFLDAKRIAALVLVVPIALAAVAAGPRGEKA